MIDPEEELPEALAALSFSKPPKLGVKRKRIGALSKAHEFVVSSCLSYRFRLSVNSEMRAVRSLKNFPRIVQSFALDTRVIMRRQYASQMTSLNSALTGKDSGWLPFDVKFQTQKLAQNGYLTPDRVVSLLPVVRRLMGESGNVAAVVETIQKLFGQIPFPGPETEASALTLETLSEILVNNHRSALRVQAFANDLANQYDHITMVHKATVTPTGIYLYGPYPEVKNRVLRTYSDFPNHFLSVSFLDEDGEPIRYNRWTTNEDIYHQRFKKVTNGIINIAGRGYQV